MMCYSQPERMEVIRLVEESELTIAQTLEELGMPQSTRSVFMDIRTEYSMKVR